MDLHSYEKCEKGKPKYLPECLTLNNIWNPNIFHNPVELLTWVDKNYNVGLKI